MVNSLVGSASIAGATTSAMDGALLENVVSTAITQDVLNNVQSVLNNVTGAQEIEAAATQIASLLNITANNAAHLVRDALNGDLIGGNLESALNDILTETVAAGIDQLLGNAASGDLMNIISGLLNGLNGAAVDPVALLAALNTLGISLESLGLSEEHMNALLGLSVPLCPAAGAMMPCENLAWSLAPEQQASAITVSNQAQLLQALDTVRASGGTILLAAGNYGSFNLNNYNPGGTVTIGSADPNNKAVINQLHIRNSSNMVIGNLQFQYEGRASTDGQVAALALEGTDNIQVVGNMFSGYTVQPGQYTPDSSARDQMHEVPLDGFGTGRGFSTTSSNNTTLSGNTFDNLSYAALNTHHADNVRVVGNTFTRITVDAMNGNGGTNVLFQGNYVTNSPTPPGMAHDDIIQYRVPSTGPTNLQIIGNYFDAGTKQGIFLNNECINGSSIASLTTSGTCDPNRGRYHGVTVADNTVIGSQMHGIVIGAGDNISVTNNRVAGDCNGRATNIKQIAVSHNANNVTMTGNTASRVHAGYQHYMPGAGPTGSNWNMSSNTIDSTCITPEALSQAPGCTAGSAPTELAEATIEP